MAAAPTPEDEREMPPLLEPIRDRRPDSFSFTQPPVYSDHVVLQTLSGSVLVLRLWRMPRPVRPCAVLLRPGAASCSGLGRARIQRGMSGSRLHRREVLGLVAHRAADFPDHFQRGLPGAGREAAPPELPRI